MADRRAFSVAIFVRNAGAVLLIHHRRLQAWLPVGGELEPGETPLEAAIRELYEETGLHGRFPPGLGVTGTPPGFLGYEEHAAGSKGLHMNFSFVSDVDGRDLRPCAEWDGARWVTQEELDGPELGGDLRPNVRELAGRALALPQPR
jgi:8-oxo-dGTP diphosphatase